MFTLFYNLYFAMFKGEWYNYTITNIAEQNKNAFNAIGTFLTSIFGDNQMTNLGDSLINESLFGSLTIISPVSLVLALITCIGIVVMAVKGIKRVFSIFFMGIRR